MENRGGERGGIETHVRENVGDFEQVGKIGFAGAAELIAVALGGDLVGAPDHPGIFGGAVLAEIFEKFLEARVELTNGAVAVKAQRDFVRRRHGLVYAGKEPSWRGWSDCWRGKKLKYLNVPRGTLRGALPGNSNIKTKGIRNLQFVSA